MFRDRCDDVLTSESLAGSREARAICTAGVAQPPNPNRHEVRLRLVPLGVHVESMTRMSSRAVSGTNRTLTASTARCS